eukprot:TRINITY_DN35410_c0_g1_i3.p1 TRINITY_DN35410_c0_g1~~TRINITY_DN35410_c0_g1_i3.p1  ORF type:complete len:183 (+),score=26.21 TRINITY_DN35410_c0_g1_i3:88-636(+)
MPVAYPGLAVTVKNTFLHVEHGFRELSTPRTKKRRSSWSGGSRSTARDAGIQRDDSLTLATDCDDEAEREALSAPRCDPASTHKSKPLLATSPQNYCSPTPTLEKPGALHDPLANISANVCSKCGLLHRAHDRPAKHLRTRIKQAISSACQIQDDSQRMWHLKKVVEQHGTYACRLRTAMQV